VPVPGGLRTTAMTCTASMACSWLSSSRRRAFGKDPLEEDDLRFREASDAMRQRISELSESLSTSFSISRDDRAIRSRYWADCRTILASTTGPITTSWRS
jgi:hypothetical protein